MKKEAEVNRAVRLYGDMVRRICLKSLKNDADAEDVFQEVFLKYILSEQRFESDAHEKAWLIRVAVNTCKDVLKSSARRRTCSIEELSSEPYQLQMQQEESLWNQVGELPEKYRDVIYLFYHDGYSAVEIARIMNRRENTIYTWLDRGRKELKKQMKYACLAVFLLAGGIFGKVYFTPDAYIDLDVNPSIELTLNRFDQVIASGAYNEDGEAILGSVKVRFAAYQKAVEQILDEMNAKGYMQEGGLVSATIQTDADDREEKLLTGLQETIAASDEKNSKDMEMEVYAVTEEVKHCAEEEHLSPAKYLAIQELLQVDENASMDECRDHTIKELKQMTEEHHDSHGESEEEEDSHEESEEKESSSDKSEEHSKKHDSDHHE